MLGLDARNRISGQVTGNSICVLKGKLEQVSQKPAFRERKVNNSFFQGIKLAFPAPCNDRVVRTVPQIYLCDYKELSALKSPFLSH